MNKELFGRVKTSILLCALTLLSFKTKNTKMTKIKQPIYYLQWMLIVFSIIAFLLTTIEGFKMSFDISSIGFQEYLKLFTPYSILFSATFIVLTTHLAIERIGLMIDANNNSYKASNRTIWIQTVKEFLTELKEENPHMLKDFSKQLFDLHDYLFEKQYKLASINDTNDFFDTFFKNRVQFYEEMNTKHANIAVYHDNHQSYSWDGFRYLIIVMVNSDKCYPKFLTDLRELYQKEVIEFSNSNVDGIAYELAHQEYIKRKLKCAQLR